MHSSSSIVSDYLICFQLWNTAVVNTIIIKHTPELEHSIVFVQCTYFLAGVSSSW